MPPRATTGERACVIFFFSFILPSFLSRFLHFFPLLFFSLVCLFFCSSFLSLMDSFRGWRLNNAHVQLFIFKTKRERKNFGINKFILFFVTTVNRRRLQGIGTGSFSLSLLFHFDFILHLIHDHQLLSSRPRTPKSPVRFNQRANKFERYRKTKTGIAGNCREFFFLPAMSAATGKNSEITKRTFGGGRRRESRKTNKNTGAAALCHLLTVFPTPPRCV